MQKPPNDPIKELIRELQGRVKVDDVLEHCKRPSASKRGPGRYHSDGLPTYRAPKGPGLGADWLGVNTNAARNTERDLKRQLGARQFKRQLREQRRQQQVRS